MVRFLFVGLFCATLCSGQSPATEPVSAQLQQLSKRAKTITDRQQADSAWQYAIKPGLPLLRQLADTALVGRQFRGQQIVVYRLQRKHKEAIDLCKSLIRLCQQAGDKVMEGAARTQLCITYSSLGMVQEAISESYNNVNLFLRPPNHGLLSRSYAMLAKSYEQLDDSIHVAYFNNLSIQHGKLSDRPDLRVVSLLNEGVALFGKMQVKKAIQSYKAVLKEISGNADLEQYKPPGLVGLAEAYRFDNQLDESMKTAKEAIANADCWKDSRSKMQAYVTIAEVEATRQHNSVSLDAALNALSLSNAFPFSRQTALESVNEAQARVGDYKAAFETSRQLAALTDSLNRTNKAEALANAEVRFGVQTKNATIDLLNKNAALRQQQTRQQQQTAGLIIGLLLTGLVAVGFFGYRTWQQRQTLARQKAEIETQARQLTDLNRLKDQLFSIVSHDLRGPVTSLQASIDRLDPDSSGLSTAEAIAGFRQSADAIKSLTDNMLYWALSQMGGLNTRPQVVDLPAVLTDVLALYQEPIRQKKLHLTLPNAQALTVIADENQLDIVVRNIIQNAVKFSPVGGQLRLAVEQVQPDRLTLTVTNDGPAYSWEPGAVVSPGPRMSQSGTGLGLAVVAELMRLNGGAVILAAQPDAAGTQARLTFLRSSAA